MRLAATLALGVLAATLALPMATADHVYSHTYLVTGRVFDVNGEPAMGVPVRAFLAGAHDGGPCNTGDAPRTNHFGDFQRCLHVHGMSGDEEVVLTLGEDSRRVPVDALTRKTVVYHTLNDTWPEKDEGTVQFWGTAYLVKGRVMERTPAPTAVEGIVVNGTTENHEWVEIVLELASGETRRAEARTNGYGMYEAELTLPEAPEGGLVRVTYGNETRTVPASTELQRTDLDVIFGEGPVAAPTDHIAADELPPGATTPTPLSPVVGVAGLGLAAAALARRARRA